MLNVARVHYLTPEDGTDGVERDFSRQPRYGSSDGGTPMDYDSRFARLEEHARNTDSNISEIKADIREIRGSISSLKTWMCSTILASTLAALAINFGIVHFTANSLEKHLTGIFDIKLEKLDQKIDHNQQINEMKFDKILDELARINKKLDEKAPK